MVKYFFKPSKASCASRVHWNMTHFLRSLKNGSPLMPSHEMNLLRAAIHPIKFWKSWRLSGGFILVIANTFSRVGSIPHRETIYPTNFPEDTLNVHFSGFSSILNFLRLSKVSAWSETSPSSSRVFTTHVMHIYFHVTPKLRVQTPLYTPLISFTHTFKSEGHGYIKKCNERSDKRCLDLVFYLERDLVIP
jgi:hypothetical protein